MKNTYAFLLLFLIIPLILKAQEENFSAHYTSDVYFYTAGNFESLAKGSKMKSTLLSQNSQNRANVRNNREEIDNVLNQPVVAQVAKTDLKMLVTKNFIKITTSTIGYDENSKENTPQTNVVKIDKARGLVYDEGKKQFFRVKQVEVTGAGDLLQVHTEKSNSYAFLDPETPKSLLRLCAASDVKIHGGINVIVRENAVTRLLGWEKSSKILDYSKLFKNVKNPEDLETFDFF